MFEGYFGYSLPTTCCPARPAGGFSSITLGMPVIGTWLHWAALRRRLPGEISSRACTPFTSC